MARTTVPRSDTSLPAVCCVCGKAASRTRSETFSWSPSWIIVLIPFGVVTWWFAWMLLRQRAALALPVCDRHARRSRLAWKVFAAGLILAVAAGFASDYVPASRRTDVIAGSVLFGLFSAVVAVGLADDRVRAKRIDDRSVTLDRVSDAFAAAVDSAGRRPDRSDHSDRWPPSRAGATGLATARYYRG